MIIDVFTIREFAKPLHDAKSVGRFVFIGISQHEFRL